MLHHSTVCWFATKTQRDCWLNTFIFVCPNHTILIKSAKNLCTKCRYNSDEHRSVFRLHCHTRATNIEQITNNNWWHTIKLSPFYFKHHEIKTISITNSKKEFLRSLLGCSFSDCSMCEKLGARVTFRLLTVHEKKQPTTNFFTGTRKEFMWMWHESTCKTLRWQRKMRNHKPFDNVIIAKIPNGYVFLCAIARHNRAHHRHSFLRLTLHFSHISHSRKWFGLKANKKSINKFTVFECCCQPNGMVNAIAGRSQIEATDRNSLTLR